MIRLCNVSQLVNFPATLCLIINFRYRYDISVNFTYRPA